jgi:hypothetical protein
MAISNDLIMVENNSGVSGLSALGQAKIAHVVNWAMPYVIGAALIFVFIYLIMGGFGIMTSKADPKAMEAAKQKITSAIIGFIIIFTAYWLVQLLGLAFGLGNLQNQGNFGGLFK